MQLTLSLFLVGMAVSQLVLGTLSDRFGRRPVMLAGLALTVVASFAALASTSIVGLIVARTFQAFGATVGIVVGRAVIRDLYERDRAASMIGWVTMAMVIAPMIAPLIGGALDTALGWQAIFAFMGLFAAIVLVWVAFPLPETRAVATGEGFGAFPRGIGRACSPTARYLGYALVAATNSAMFFTFIGGAPHVVVTQMHRTSAEYGVWFVLISLTYMVGNFTAGRWSAKYGVDFMIRAGVAVTVFGVAGRHRLDAARPAERPGGHHGAADDHRVCVRLHAAELDRGRRQRAAAGGRRRLRHHGLHADGARRRDRATCRLPARRRARPACRLP